MSVVTKKINKYSRNGRQHGTIATICHSGKHQYEPILWLQRMKWAQRNHTQKSPRSRKITEEKTKKQTKNSPSFSTNATKRALRFKNARRHPAMEPSESFTDFGVTQPWKIDEMQSKVGTFTSLLRMNLLLFWNGHHPFSIRKQA